MAQFAGVPELRDFLRDQNMEMTDPRAVLMLEASSAAVQSYCRQRLEFVADDTQSLRGSWDAALQLPERPVTALTAITVAEAAVDAASFFWNRRGEVRWGQPVSDLIAPAGLWGGPDVEILVTYSHGYAPIPDDVKLACLSIAAGLITQPSLGVASESIGDYSVSYVAGEATRLIGAAEAALLSRYRVNQTLSVGTA